MHSNMFSISLLVILSFVNHVVFATTYPLKSPTQSLVGHIQYVRTIDDDNVISLAEKFDVGFNEIKSANPNLNFSKTFYPGTLVTIPTQHLLPETLNQGIVINLPEMRLYYFPANESRVLTYPIGIGKIGNTIPIKNTIILRKTENPTWFPTDNIRKFNLEQGIVLPKEMPAGPDNPLGQYAIYTGLSTYLIHSTIFPESVGKRASFGCIRMFVSDIEEFFPTIFKKMPVSIINEPVKLRFENDKLYMESHEPLEEYQNDYHASLPFVVNRITQLIGNERVIIDWQLVSALMKTRDGMPHEIGFKLRKH